MGLSVIHEQGEAILQEIKNITQGDWKCLVVDSTSKKIIDNAVKEDDILNNNIATIERIEDRRERNPDMDAIYILSPEPHIVDCLLADFEARRYRSAYLVWTTLIKADLRRKIDDFPGVRSFRASTKTLFIDFYPRESHVVTFRDPWSFPSLYHRECDSLVAAHLKTMAQKIAGVCITLGEYPKVRYYKPRDPTWDAAVLCTHLANFVQQELDMYAQWNADFPPATTRPQATLVITDRSMDPVAPLVHEFTYQAMAHDLLPIKEGDKITYTTVINKGTDDEEEKNMELSDRDKLWVDNRHQHMKDMVTKLQDDIRKFIQQNPHFANEDTETTNLNTIRDMLSGLPQFQEMRDAYSLHLSMAQECTTIFSQHNLPDIAMSEQTMATGLDEDNRKPKNVLDEVVRLLDEPTTTPPDRLRLIILFALYREGVIMEDVKRLLAHAGLPQQDGDALQGLEMLGARAIRQNVKDVKQPRHVLFPKDPKAVQPDEEVNSLSRFDPTLKPLLDTLTRGSLDQTDFPYVKPPLDPNEDLLLAQGGSLRAGRPNWAAAGRRAPENRHRIFVFMAGGATHSESRTCYEVGAERNRDIVLITSHMITPQLYVRQLSDLCRSRRQLDLPVDRPRQRAPAHLFERPKPPPQQLPSGPGPGQGPRPGQPMGGAGLPSQPQQRIGGPSPHQRPPPSRGGSSQAAPSSGRMAPPPTQQMGNMSLGSNGGGHPSHPSHQQQPSTASSQNSRTDEGKLHKEKKRRNFLGMKK